MKTSAFIARARNVLWHPDEGKIISNLGTYRWSCHAIEYGSWSRADLISQARDRYSELLPEEAIHGGFEYSEDFKQMSPLQQQEFRYLFMCMAEEYFKSIDD